MVTLRILLDVGDEQPTPADIDLHLRVTGGPTATGGHVGGRRIEVVHAAATVPDKRELRQIFAAALYGH